MACGSMGMYLRLEHLFPTNQTRYDGQAGAAAITLEEHSPAFEAEFMSHLYKILKKKGVPPYAFPRLVRITEK